jgi:hypothetical protein
MFFAAGKTLVLLELAMFSAAAFAGGETPLSAQLAAAVLASVLALASENSSGCISFG